MDQNDTVKKNTKLEIKIISAKNLWSFNFFQKLTVYTVAFLSDEPNKLSKQQKQEQRTPVDPDGDGHPDWHHNLTFNLSDLHPPLSDLFLNLELRHQAGFPFPDRTIGVVKVPLSDLIHDSSSAALRFVDYQVRSPEGKPNGEIRFSYNVINPTLPVYPPLAISGYPKISDDPPVSDFGYPKLSDEPGSPISLNPAAAAANLDTVPAPEHQNHGVPPPMWGYGPPPPPPPYWAHHPGYMYHPPPPPPPPPGYFNGGMELFSANRRSTE